MTFNKTPEEHLEHVESVLQTLSDHTLFAQLEKCTFNTDTVEFLGHVVSKDGIRPDPKKIQVVQDWPRPETAKQLRSFLG